LSTKSAYYSAEQKRKYVSSGKVSRISKGGLSRITIPLPPLEEQRRIVSILDKFDALVNDLSSGIPAEIEARRKQYEYYRDKLLTFKEKPGD
uniref:restriction endonuclease subunit S n=1 Tax=Candidatus Collinsella stercoripullorum TaxID=2838522 RepID=UPI0022E6E135